MNALVVKRTSWLPPKEQVQVRLLAGVLFRAGVGLMASRLPWEQDTTGFDSPVPDWFAEKDILAVCRPARDFAKVADQVRFLTGMLVGLLMVGMV
jgi:hypothetical protein